jgi:flagellar protein FliS
MQPKMPDPRSVALAYRQATVENAPPIKIVRLLYEGAIRFLDRAVAADPVDAQGGFATACSRADAIANELRCSLDHTVEPATSHDLDRLYLFVQDRIAKAVIDRTGEPLPAARHVMATLLEGWTQVEVETSAPAQH